MYVCMYVQKYQPIPANCAAGSVLISESRPRMSHDASTERAEGYVYADIRNIALTKPFSGYLRDSQRINQTSEVPHRICALRQQIFID